MLQNDYFKNSELGIRFLLHKDYSGNGELDRWADGI